MTERKVFDKNRIQRGKGFTLVELIVVVMITLILAGGVVFGITRWITKMNFKRQNEYAQTLFFAAQDQLANYSENGLLTELTENVPDSAYLSNSQITAMTSCTGDQYAINGVWVHSNGNNLYQGQIASLIGTPADYAVYQSYLNAEDSVRKTMEKDKAVILYSILSPYVYDQSIFSKGVVCLEFTPADGQVFAAFYSDAKQNLAYTDEHTETTGAMNNRTDSFRITGMVGYFGVDTLSKATNLNKDKPAIKNLSLNNEETLNLSFGISNVNVSAAISQLNYYIDICDSKTGAASPVMRIEMTGAQLMEPGEPLSRERRATKVKVILYGDKGKNQELQDVPIQTWIDEKSEIHIVLDGADLDADCQKAEALYGEKKVNELDLFKTFSFHRFGLDDRTENIFCLVEADGAMYRKTAQKKSGTENLYFGAVTQSVDMNETKETAERPEDIKDVVYTIENGRHLYNIRYMEEVQRLRTTKYPSAERITYRLVNDVDWKSMLDQNALYASPMQRSSDSVSRVYKTDSEDAEFYLVFPSIRKLQSNSVLESRSEDADTCYKITGLKITEEQNQAYQVYETADSTSSERQTGLFCVNEGWISDVNLGSCWVRGTENVGILCGVNRGVIQNVKVLKNSADKTELLKSSVVSGVENVGGIAGTQEEINSAKQVPQKPEDSKKEAYVLEQAARLKNNFNYADIYGVKNAGGIIGCLTTKDTQTESGNDVRVESCVNYGKVREADIVMTESTPKDNEILFTELFKDYLTKVNITSAENFKTQYCNFGGIAGKIEKGTAPVSISLCTSSSVYTEEESNALIQALKAGEIYSNCVGGIIGYNDGAVVKACNTEKENSSEEAFVFGNRHVGGIIGWNYVSGDTIMVLDGTSDADSYSINQSNVIGNEYVGGVVGMNAGEAKQEDTANSSSEAEEKDLHSTKPLVDTNGALLIKNWMNQGVVIARKQYAGGIAGCNTGIISACRSDVANSMKLTTLTKKLYTGTEDRIGNYVGGMAGYNNGIITNQSVSDTLVVSNNENQIGLVVYLTGKNYVGGIAGYNDENAQIRGIKLDGGTIDGKGCCVGGIAGFNASVQLLSSTTDNIQKLNANPNVVNGTYMVGGTIGANVIDAGQLQDGSDIKAEFRTDNFLGKLTAQAFAGGFIGYNHVLKVGGSQEQSRLAIKNEIDRLTSELEKEEGKTEASLQKTVSLVEHAFQNSFSSVQNQSRRMQIDAASKANSGDTKSATLRGITANIYVGGVLGYNSDDTQLLISNQKNTTPVIAKMAIVNANEQPGKKTFNEKDFEYSYAGGIIGKVTEFCIIYKCGNTDRGTVITNGTYTGGLCEINEGTIQECEVSSVGDKVDYVGGLVGVNKQKGFIYQCSLDGQTITGKNIVGGLAAENYGVIDSGKIQNLTITAGGDNVGGIVGWNHNVNRDKEKEYYYIENKAVKQKKYTQTSSVVLLNQPTLSVSSIQADGAKVGAVIGWNQGVLDIATTDNQKVSLVGRTNSSAIIGKENVGGFVGCEDGAGVQKLINEIHVQALDGNAGGIIGIMIASEASVRDCVNKGEVSAENSGNAGGITSENMGTISDCADYAAVSAKNGYSGGIAAVNGSEANSNAKISQCKVTTYGKNLVFSGKQCAGGITARNYAAVENCSVSGDGTNAITVSNLAESANVSVLVSGLKQEGSMIGGIAGINEDNGKIINCSVGANKTNEANPDKWNIVTTESKAAKAFAGGIAGLNRGSIKGTETAYSKVFAKVCFTTQNRAYFGYLGGIAGQNRGIVENYEFNGTVEGTTNNPSDKPVYNPNTDYESGSTKLYGYGGIAGVNGIADKAKTGETKTKAQISECKVNIAEISGYGEATNIANIGGVAGINGIGSEVTRITYGSAPVFANVKGNNIQSQKNSVYVHDAVAKKDGFAHIGGAVGLNCGTVSDIGYLDTGEVYDPKIDEQRVAVDSYRGHVGGMIGWNRRSGIIQRTATGKNWIVQSLNSAQDNGCAGIIGYQNGESGVAYCTNRASVEKYVSGSNTVGGIIGRNEVSTAKNYTISNCINYGKIRGQRRVGGIMGVMKYNAGTFYECINYGDIYTDSEGGAGIVAKLYGVKASNGTVSFIKCQNHGNIAINNAIPDCGGILGISSDSGSAVLRVEDCVNTGLISPHTGSAGLIGGDSSFINRNSVISNCRNYGYGYNNKSVLGGIVSDTISANIEIQNCFGLANTSNPICESTSLATESNYYLTEQTDGTLEEDSDRWFVNKVTAKGKVCKNPEYLVKIMMLDGYENTKSLLNTYFENLKVSENNSISYEFSFNAPVNLKKIDLFWFRNKQDWRVTDYNVLYHDPDNDDWICAKKVRNTVNESELKEDEVALANMNLIKNLQSNSVETRAEEQETVELDLIKTDGVKIEIIKSVQGTNMTTGKNCSLLRVGFNDYPDNGFPSEATKISKLGSTTNGDGYMIKSPFSVGKSQIEQGIITYNDGKEMQATVYPLYMEKMSENQYKMALNAGVSVGISGIPVDIYKQMETNEALTDTNLKVITGKEDNIRYRTFLQVDPYLTTNKNMESLPDGETVSIKKPEKIELNTETDGTYHASWKISNETEGAKNPIVYNCEVIYRDAEERQIGIAYQNLIYGTDNRTTAFPSCPSADAAPDYTKSTFRVRAGVRVRKEAGKIVIQWTDYAETDLSSLAQALPLPRFHLELKLLGNNQLRYQFILDNQDEYIEFLKTHTQKGTELTEEEIQNKLTSIKIVVKVNDVEQANYLFTAADGRSQTMDISKMYAGGASNIMFGCYAKDLDGEYSDSQIYLRESMARMQSDLTGNAMAIIRLCNQDPGAENSLGFHGTSMDQLEYQVLIQNVGVTFIGYMNTVMLATDQELQVPVVVSSAQGRVSNTTSGAIRLYLNGLPQNLLDQTAYRDLKVRSYPVMFSNNIVFFGHEVMTADGQKHFTKEEIMKLKIAPDGTALSEDDTETADDAQLLILDGKLKNGYILQLNNDDSYSISYNALLDYFEQQNNEDYEANCKNKTENKYQIFTYDIDDADIQSNIQPQPVIKVNDHKVTEGKLQIGAGGEDGNVNEDVMCIYWDLNTDVTSPERAEVYKNNYSKTAKYQYTIYGITNETDENGQTVEKKTQLLTGTYETPASGEDYEQGLNVLRQNIDAWSYHTLEISMTRIGEEKQDSSSEKRLTTKYPVTTERRIEGLKTRLSQITKPFLDLASGGDGSLSEKDALIYDISWKPVAGEEQEDGIGSYLVKARIKGEETYTTLTALKVPRAADGKLQADASGNLNYTYEVDGKTYTTTDTKVRLNLKAYEGQEIEVAIQAVAQEKSEKYRNAQDGVVAEMKLPSRLPVPQIQNDTEQNPYSDYVYSMENSLSAEEFETGLLISMNNQGVDEGLRDSQSRYEIAIAVYDQPGDLSDRSKLDIHNVEENGTIGVDEQEASDSGYWNSGAVKTLIRKADGVKMDGSLQSDVCTLKLRNLSTEYAGKWLKIAMRTVSDIAISSNWTDEDEADRSVNYAWIQIPRLKEITPTLTKGTVNVYYEGTKETGYSYYGLSSTGSQLLAEQVSMSFGCQKYADTYEVRLVRTSEDADWVMVQTQNSEYCSRYYAVDFLNFVKKEDGSYEVFYASSSLGAEALPEKESEKSIGILTAGEPLHLSGLSGEAQFISNNKTYPFDLSGVVQLKNDESGNQTIEIILPNAEKIVAGSYESSNEYIYVGQTSVRAVISEDTDSAKRYASSDIRNWNTYDNKMQTFEKYTQWDEKTENANIQLRPVTAEDVAEKTDRVTYISKICLDKQLSDYVVYRIYNARTEQYEYVSSCGGGLNKVTNVAFLKRENYQIGDKLQIEAACVSVPTGAVGEWVKFNEVELTESMCGIEPKPLSPLDVVSVTPDSESGDTWYDISWNSSYTDDEKKGIRAYQIYILNELGEQISLLQTDQVMIDAQDRNYVACNLESYLGQQITLYVKALSYEDVSCNYFDSEQGSGVPIVVSESPAEPEEEEALINENGDDGSVIQETDTIEDDIVIMEEDTDSIQDSDVNTENQNQGVDESEEDGLMDASLSPMETELFLGE